MYQPDYGDSVVMFKLFCIVFSGELDAPAQKEIEGF